MTSRIFKSAVSEGRLSVAEAPNRRFTVGIRRDGVATDMVDLAPSDAPALALAILEAAGFKAEFHATGTFQDGDRWQLENVAQVIEDYLSIKNAEAAEAEAQAKLEAEALELYNVGASAVGIEGSEVLNDLRLYDRKVFLAIARKAREMRAEK